MSYFIDIPCADSLTPRDEGFLHSLFERTGFADLRVSGGDEVLAGWPRHSVYVYRDLVSCRSVEIDVPREHPGIRVVIRSFSSGDDRDLAVALASGCAGLLGSEVVHLEQEDEPAPVARLAEMLGQDWLESQFESGASTTAALVRHEQRPLELPGAVRPFWVGPRLLAELDAEAQLSGEPMHARMLRRMRRVQWVDRTDDYFPASRMQEKDTPKMTLAVWQPTVRSLLPEAVRIVINYDPKEVLILSHADFVRLAGERLTWLDEQQTLVEAFEEGEMPSLLVEARKLDLLPTLRPSLGTTTAPAEPLPSPRPWWKFCK